MKLNIRATIMIIIGILVLILGARAFKSNGQLSADVLDQTNQINESTK